ncbi:MAG: PKD domain-containing protein [Candidatus Neomarinimicrobiota bacterium]|nr:PKD domain-containing protein [Candidatus Neomarinimicrobiota bacterium]
MKKINYIIGFTISFLVLYQPIQQDVENFLAEKKRIEYEKYVNSFLGRDTISFKQSKKLPKALRPDLKGTHDYLMLHDLNTGTIPTERILTALNIAEQKRASLSYANRMSEVNWSERGPNTIGGRTRALLLDPNDSTNKKLWAAGVTGGLWYTNDITVATPTWNEVDGTWGNLAVCSISSDPNDSNVLYVGTGERMGIFSTASRGLGMWKSTDGGSTWTHLSSTENFNYVTDIIVRNESGSSVVYAGVGGHYYEGKWHGSSNTGLWRSTDGGGTWTQVAELTPAGDSRYEIMDLDLGSDNRIWAGSRTNVYGDGGGDIFYSDDGTNWTKVSLGTVGTMNRVILAVAPSDANTVYAMIENGTTRKVGWIVKTTDGGANWTVYTAGTSDPFPVDANGNVLGDANGQASYDLSLGIDPNDPNVVFAGELDVFKTTDGGASWTQVTNSGGSQYPYMHVDQHNIKFIDSNKVIFSNDGGIYYTTDAGTTVSGRNTGYNVSQFYSVALHPDTGSEYVLGGTQDNGTWNISGTGIQSGTQKVGGDGAYTHIDQVDPSYQFTATTYNSIYRSTNGGANFSYYATHEDASGGDTGFFINPSVIDGANKVFYSAVDGSTILRLNNYVNLADKTLMNVTLGSTASAFKMSPHTDGVLFVGTSSGRVFKITDAHTSSYNATEISGSSISGYIASIDIGEDDNQILVTISNYGARSVWETVGGGGSNGWVNIEGDLPDMPIRWGLYNRSNFNQVIVATELGTWVSDDVTASSVVWNPSNDGLANVRTDMLAVRPADGAMAAGTHGRGMFYSTGFTSTAPLNAAFTPDKTSGVFPLTVQFNDRSTGNPTSWDWDFGDGTTSTDQSPSHTYTASGQYNVSLTVSDGTNSTNTTKNNLIWATAQQDIIWEEQFETNPYGWSDGRRDIHEFITVNTNDDNHSWSWWYYTAGYGAHGWGATGSHWMAGLGMGDNGNSADDWLISPELWLRPGTDNILSFWTDTYDANYVEAYDVLLSPTGGSALSDFTVTLASMQDASTEWTQQTYDLTQWAGSNVRVAIHITTSNQYYAFFDSWRLTAGELSTDGAPLAPSGLTAEPELVYDATNGVWTASSDGIAVFWNRNGESDLASYNVYASQTDNFSPGSGNLLGQGTLGDINVTHLEPSPSDTPWPDSTFVTVQTFGADSLLHDGLTEGEKWYYKVGAVDNDGNETISSQVSYVLDSTGPTAGTYTINDLQDSEYLRSTSDIVISVDGWSDNVGIAYYYMGIGTTDQDLEADVVFYQNVGLTNLTLTNLTLDDYTKYYLKVAAFDESGNNSDAVISGFTTYTAMLGDYDNDWDVDVEDLNSLVNAWPNVDIGPATGTSPYLTPTLDGSADIYDISAFTRNWQWTKAQGRILEPQEDIELNPIDFPAELSGNHIKITLPDNISAGRFEIVNNENAYQFSLNNTNEGMILLQNEDSMNELYEVEFGRLSQDEKELYIYIDGDEPASTLQMNYQLFSKDGMAGNGTMQLGNPEAFKLYQNYPNPFNNQTTIRYDIPSLMVNIVPVEIYIYNTVGKLVRTIDEGDKSVGTHTVIWDGKNDDGDSVSSGVYFYQLRTKVDGQSDYNKTMKMVLVR